jgi:hypothetical protein
MPYSRMAMRQNTTSRLRQAELRNPDGYNLDSKVWDERQMIRC